jgi:hypothetical protein
MDQPDSDKKKEKQSDSVPLIMSDKYKLYSSKYYDIYRTEKNEIHSVLNDNLSKGEEYECSIKNILVQLQFHEYIIKNNIPYKKNTRININGISNALKIDFIIPNAIIFVKDWKIHYDEVFDQGFIDKHKKQLLKISEIITDNITIYFYNKTKVSDYIKECLTEIKGVTVIDNFNEIKYEKLNYFVEDPAVIRSMVSSDNPEYNYVADRYKNKICTTQTTYNNAYVLLNDESSEKLKIFDYKIVDIKTMQKYTMLTKNGRYGSRITLEKNKKISDLFFLTFEEPVNMYSLKSNMPTRHIEGITTICRVCNKIIFNTHMKNGMCYRLNNYTCKNEESSNN